MTRPPVRRIAALFTALVIGFAGIVVRLVFLQVRDSPELKNLAYEQRVRTIPLPATRGAILDRYGRELAISLQARAVYADGRYVVDPGTTATRLAPVLQLKEADLARELAHAQTQKASFVYVARQVDRAVADRVEAMNLPGIGFLDESKRYYPSGEWGAPQVLGVVGIDGEGQGGLELQYQDVLSGDPGELIEEIDPAGRPIPQGVNTVKAPAPGESIVTTIDPQLQYQAETALRAAVKTNGAKGGTVIVMDPKTGDVWAMATYRAGDGRDDPVDRLVNPALADVYEPGSVNKVITASAAVEEHKVDLQDRFSVPDSIRVYEYTIHDAEPHATETMMLGDIITHSSNVGTIEVAHRVGEETLATYLAKFGYGQPALGYEGESGGILLPLRSWSGTSLPTFAIGQGVAVTPLQMADVYATIANGGVWIRPRLVRGTQNADGAFHAAPPSETRRVVSKETADIVTGMLAHVVEAGTGTAAQIPGYWVAGKTGTGKKPKEGGGGYSNRYVASFIGFLPASDPRIVIAAIIDEPDTIYGGVAAAPLFQQLGKEAIARLHIPAGDKPDFPPSAMGHG